MKETISFILKLCFYLHHSEKINLLKTIDAANFEKVNKIKPYILQIKFQRNVDCNIYPQKLPILLVSVFICIFSLLFFSACAFMRKLLVDCSLKSLALLWVIRFWCPLEYNFYYLVKRKGAKHISKYLKMVTSNFCNKWCDIHNRGISH